MPVGLVVLAFVVAALVVGSVRGVDKPAADLRESDATLELADEVRGLVRELNGYAERVEQDFAEIRADLDRQRAANAQLVAAFGALNREAERFVITPESPPDSVYAAYGACTAARSACAVVVDSLASEVETSGRALELAQTAIDVRTRQAEAATEEADLVRDAERLSRRAAVEALRQRDAIEARYRGLSVGPGVFILRQPLSVHPGVSIGYTGSLRVPLIGSVPVVSSAVVSEVGAAGSVRLTF